MWTIWKTIKLGTAYQTAEEYESVARNKFVTLDGEIQRTKFTMDPGAWDILKSENFNTSIPVNSVDLVKVTLKELGIQEGAQYKDIAAEAQKRGLRLCPPALAPQLRLEYMDQPIGECLNIAIETDFEYPRIFGMGRNKFDFYLGGTEGSNTKEYSDEWDLDETWVFALLA